MDITNFVLSHRDSALAIGDYGTYRSQLSRRLRTLQKKLGRSTPKNAKYSAKAPVTAEDIGRNHEFVHLLLLTAERAWAHAMHMKSLHSEDNAGKGITGSTRSHIISRLNKAAKSARKLVELLVNQTASGATDNDVLEARAYAYTLSGAQEFEKQAEGVRSSDAQAQKQRWEACLTNFSAARVSYDVLLRATKKDLFKEILASTIDPSIRYAAYQSHLPRTTAIAAVARQYFPRNDSELVTALEKLDPNALSEPDVTPGNKAQGAENIPNTITWRSRKANIVDASIGQALAAVAAAETRLFSFLSSADADTPARDKAAAYDDVLIASQDATDATRRAIEELEKERVDEGDPRMQDLRVTSLAVNYDLIGWRIGRNRMLVGDDDGASLEGEKLRKPKRPRKDGKEWVEKEEGNGRKLARIRERVVLYDATLQSIDSVKELRGAVRDAAFIEELDGKRAYFQALKCLNIGYSHALLPSPKNALALFARAFDLAQKALNTASFPSSPPSSPPKLDITPTQAQSLANKLQALLRHHQGLVSLHAFAGNSRVAAEKHMTAAAPVVERLDEYPLAGVDLGRLVTYPPQLKPVPVKPLFFDVAWNYVDYPGRGKEVVEDGKVDVNGAVAVRSEEKKEEKPAKRGWFGFGRS